MSSTPQARRELARECRLAATAASIVSVPLGMWCGIGDYAQCSQAARDQAGAQALARLNEAIGQLTAVRDRLARHVEG